MAPPVALPFLTVRGELLTQDKMVQHDPSRAKHKQSLKERFHQYITLQKDSKHICRFRPVNSFPDLPSSTWDILDFKSADIMQNLNLNSDHKFQLYPDPDNSYQVREWPKFAKYLHQSKKVGIVNLDGFRFFLHTPTDEPDYLSHLSVSFLSPRPIATFPPQITPPEVEINEGSQKEVVSMEVSADNLGSVQMDYNNNKSPPACHSSGEPAGAKKLAFVMKNFSSTYPTYLKTLSQTHGAWIFGAIAELVDNSRDANSNRLDISIESLYSKKEGKTIPVLSIVDDGHGMTHDEIMRMICFGHSLPDQSEPERVGRFGIGFKTGSMRLGKDAIVLTQTSTSRSVALLSQSFNKDKSNLEIPVVSYTKKENFMEVDLNIQSECSAEYHLNAIKDFSPFNEYFIGEKLGLFGHANTGTQIYIWNLDKWGENHSLEWDNEDYKGDILIRSKRVRSRPGQITQQVPLDYSLKSYLEVIFLNPRMRIYIQGNLVKTRPLARSLNKTAIVNGQINGKPLLLTIGRSKIEWERMNSGIFLYWHGRLIEAYKRVGGQVHNADMGRGVIGVVDVTKLIDDDEGNSFVLNSKQGFQDCETYAKLEEWLGKKADEYYDTNYDTLDLRKGSDKYKPDNEWVQCDKCRKWRILSSDYDSKNLPQNWFCYMEPFKGKCEMPEQQMQRGVITVSAKRSGNEIEGNITEEDEESNKPTKRGGRKCSNSPGTNRSRKSLPRGPKGT
ncbi:hypothetical protein LUZ60_011739 [Juncus effusus]|nr:hypothetical protein LUZ60_011739 [Juncus effusus]